MTAAPKIEASQELMEELCDLLRQVLGKGADAAVSTRIEELLSELSRIRAAMEVHARALERLLPGITEVDTLRAHQISLEQRLSKIDKNTSWICHALGQAAFREGD